MRQLVCYIYVVRALSQQLSSLNSETLKKLLELKCGQKIKKLLVLGHKLGFFYRKRVFKELKTSSFSVRFYSDVVRCEA